MRTLLRSLDRLFRWNVFLTHCNLNASEVIDVITEKTLLDDSTEFTTLQAKLMENVRTHKSTKCRNMKAYILRLLDEKPHSKAVPLAEFSHFMEGRFNAQNFDVVFKFMRGYVVIDNSSDLEQNFMRCMFTNLAREVFPNTVLKHGNPLANVGNEEVQLQKAWDYTTRLDFFDGVNTQECQGLHPGCMTGLVTKPSLP